MLNIMVGLMRMKGWLTDWLTGRLKGTEVAEHRSHTVTAHTGRHMHAAAQLHLACDRCVSTLVGCTSSTVYTLNRLQQGHTWNAELCALTCALPPLLCAPFSCLFLWSFTPNARQAFDQRHLREAVVPAAAKCGRQETTRGLPIVQVAASVIKWHLAGPSLHGAAADSSMATSRAPPIVDLN